MQVSDHFELEEFECQCGCGFNSVSLELIDVLEDVRTHFNSPVTITSSCRCNEHNHKVGGVANSEHTRGTAADFIVRGVSPSDVYRYLDQKYPNKYGIGSYARWTHIDVREVKTRWKK